MTEYESGIRVADVTPWDVLNLGGTLMKDGIIRTVNGLVEQDS